MIDGGADIARLGLELDGREFFQAGDQAVAALERLAEAGEAARAEIRRIEEAQRESARAASEAASADERLARTLDDGLAERAASEEREAQARAQRRDQEIQEAVAAEEERFRAAAEVAQRAQEERRSREAAEAEASVAEAARAGQDQALAQVVAMQATFASEMARVKEAVARGLLTPEEARQAALAAGEAYNEELLRVIASVRDAGGFDADGGAEVYATLVGSLQNLDEGGQRAAVGLGRLNQALTSTLRQATGLNPAVAQLVNTIGGMALGGALMTGVLAGGAALSLMLNRAQEDARRAREEQENATRVLEGLRRAAEAPWEEAASSVENYQQRVREAREEIERLEAELDRLQRMPTPTASFRGPSADMGAGIQTDLSARFTENQQQIQQNLDNIEFMERRITQIQEQAQADRLSRLVSANQATAREREEAVRVAEDLERRLAEAMSDDSREGQEERVRLIGLLGGLTTALERRAEATDRAAEASRRFMADLRLQVEEEERLLEASRMGAQAMEAEAQAIERENAMRQASAQAMASEREEAERLAAVRHDLRMEREAELRAQALAEEMQRSNEDLEHLQAMVNLTREHAGTSEELQAAQRELTEAFEDRMWIEEMILAGWDPDAARARVEAERDYRAELEASNEAQRRRERSESFLRGRERELNDMQRLIDLHSELGDNTEKLEAAVAAYNRELAERAMIEAAIRAGFEGDMEDLREFVSRYIEAEEGARALGRAGVESAELTHQAWSAALGAISTGMGGLASEFASIAQSFLAGGPVGLIGSISGSMLGRIFGGDNNAERAAEEQARLAEAAARAADALAEYTRRLEDDVGVRRLTLDGDQEAAERLRLEIAQRRERDEFTAQFADAFNSMGPDFEEAMRLWAELILLQEAEAKALVERQQAAAREREEARAARDQEEAVRRLLEARQLELDLIAREGSLRGDEAVAFEARSRARAEAEMARAQELLEAGKISEEAFARIIAVIEGELDQALVGYIDRLSEQAEAARQAEEAEAARQEQDLQNLELRRMRALGMDEEYHQLRALMELEQARRDERSAEYIAMLQEIQAIQAATRAREHAAAAEAEAQRIAEARARQEAVEAREAERLARLEAAGGRLVGGTRVSRAQPRPSIVQVSGDNYLQGILDSNRAIERNTAPLQRMQGLGAGGTQINLTLTQRAGEDMEAFAGRAIGELDQVLERERRRGERDRGSGRTS